MTFTPVVLLSCFLFMPHYDSKAWRKAVMVMVMVVVVVVVMLSVLGLPKSHPCLIRPISKSTFWRTKHSGVRNQNRVRKIYILLTPPRAFICVILSVPSWDAYLPISYLSLSTDFSTHLIASSFLLPLVSQSHHQVLYSTHLLY